MLDSGVVVKHIWVIFILSVLNVNLGSFDLTVERKRMKFWDSRALVEHTDLFSVFLNL